MDEERKVTGEISRDITSGKIRISIRTPIASPALLHYRDKLNRIASGSIEDIKLSVDYFRFDRCRAAVCQSAFLLMFSHFGYSFARNPSYTLLRKQIMSPDEKIWNGYLCILDSDNCHALENQQAVVLFLREPVQAIAALLRFKSPSNMERIVSVILPGPGESSIESMNSQAMSGYSIRYDAKRMITTKNYLSMMWHSWKRSQQL